MRASRVLLDCLTIQVDCALHTVLTALRPEESSTHVEVVHDRIGLCATRKSIACGSAERNIKRGHRGVHNLLLDRQQARPVLIKVFGPEQRPIGPCEFGRHM